MNKDNEKDYDLMPIPIAQQGKRQNPVQGEPSKTDPEKVTCPVCQKDFKRRGLPIHQAKSGCKAKLQQQVQHRISSKSEASNTQEENHSGIASCVSLNEKEAISGVQSPKVITEQAKQVKEKKQTRLSNWLQINSIEQAKGVQPSNPGTKPRENERDRESSLEQEERMVIDRKKIDRENKRKDGNILAWIKSQENQNPEKETEKSKESLCSSKESFQVRNLKL